MSLFFIYIFSVYHIFMTFLVLFSLCLWGGVLAMVHITDSYEMAVCSSLGSCLFLLWYISFDFIDIDTRRRAACDLVRGLCKFFEGPVTGIFSGYVNSMLQEHAKNPSVNWKHKDAAIYLVTSLASKAQTQKVNLFDEFVSETEVPVATEIKKKWYMSGDTAHSARWPVSSDWNS